MDSGWSAAELRVSWTQAYGNASKIDTGWEIYRTQSRHELLLNVTPDESVIYQANLSFPLTQRGI